MRQVLSLNASVNYYTTKENYASDGTLQAPFELLSYSRESFDTTLTYGINDRFSIFGNMSWARVQVESGGKVGSIFGLADQSIGANYRIYQVPGITADLQLQVDLPAYSNNTATAQQTPWLGDATTDLTAGGFLSAPLLDRKSSLLSLGGGAGYTRRNGGYSAAVPWMASAKYLAKDSGIQFSLGMDGAYSLQTDKSKNSASAIGSGGSFMTGAVNPSLALVRGQAAYFLSNDLNLSLSAAKSIAGQNAPAGMIFLFGLEARLSGAPRANPLQLTPGEYGHANKGFVNYSSDEAKVLRMNDRLNLVKIDKGSQHGIEVGQIFDIFSVNQNGTIGEPVARGKVTSVKSDEAALTVTEYYKEVWINEGFIVKRPVE